MRAHARIWDALVSLVATASSTSASCSARISKVLCSGGGGDVSWQDTVGPTRFNTWLHRRLCSRRSQPVCMHRWEARTGCCAMLCKPASPWIKVDLLTYRHAGRIMALCAPFSWLRAGDRHRTVASDSGSGLLPCLTPHVAEDDRSRSKALHPQQLCSLRRPRHRPRVARHGGASTGQHRNGPAAQSTRWLRLLQCNMRTRVDDVGPEYRFEYDATAFLATICAQHKC